MKVQQLFYQLQHRGGERVADALHRELEEIGHDVDSVAFVHREGSPRPHSTRFRYLLPDRSTGGFGTAARGIVRLIQSWRSDRRDAVVCA